MVVMYTIENQHLHLGGGASEKEDSASPREDKILPRTCMCFFHDTPPLIIRNHPPYHLHMTLVVLLNTCTWIYIIPRLYPTLKSSSFSLADDSGPPLQSIFVSKHHKSPYSLDASTSL